MSARCVRQRTDEHVSQVVSALDWGNVRRGASQLSGRGGGAGWNGWMAGRLAGCPAVRPAPVCDGVITHQLRKSTGPVRLRPDSKPRREGRRQPGFPPCDVSNSLPDLFSSRKWSNCSPRLPSHSICLGVPQGETSTWVLVAPGGSFPPPVVGGRVGVVVCWMSRSGKSGKG